MPNAKDATALTTRHKILIVGGSGSGKTSQIWTLPGRKFAYFFDPAALPSVMGLDIDYEMFLPDSLELDATLKGFNKNSKDDKVPDGKPREPGVYKRWVEDLNKRDAEGYFKNIDWLIIDSLTLLANAVMDRQMWLNNRYGGIEDLGDYRIVGSKLTEVFRSITSIDVNLFCTGHISTFQDELTKRIISQLQLPGKARTQLPLYFSNIWEARSTNDEKTGFYNILTKAEPRGFQEIRSSLQGLKPIEDVTIKDFNKPEDSGIGRLIKTAKPRVSASIGNRPTVNTNASAAIKQMPPVARVEPAPEEPKLPTTTQG